VPNEKTKLFADDAGLFVFENSSAALNEKSNFCINELNKWFVANKLRLNLTKTCYMVLSYKTLIVLNYIVVNTLLKRLITVDIWELLLILS
jgi:hypothetical protein